MAQDDFSKDRFAFQELIEESAIGFSDWRVFCRAILHIVEGLVRKEILSTLAWMGSAESPEVAMNKMGRRLFETENQPLTYFESVALRYLQAGIVPSAKDSNTDPSVMLSDLARLAKVLDMIPGENKFSELFFNGGGQASGEKAIAFTLNHWCDLIWSYGDEPFDKDLKNGSLVYDWACQILELTDKVGSYRMAVKWDEENNCLHLNAGDLISPKVWSFVATIEFETQEVFFRWTHDPFSSSQPPFGIWWLMESLKDFSMGTVH